MTAMNPNIAPLALVAVTSAVLIVTLDSLDTRADMSLKGYYRRQPPPAIREIAHDADGTTMVVVPASVFKMGTDEFHDDLPERPFDGKAKAVRPRHVLLVRAEHSWRHADEQPVRLVRLDGYAIDRYEVTNAQYRKFLAAIESSGGSSHEDCHRDEGEHKDHTPRYWREYNPLLKKSAQYASTTPFHAETFTQDDKPVVAVDWYDAYGYCAWAGKRLPTEAEWELASRGHDGRRWPWGSEWNWKHANTGGEKKGLDISAKGYEKDGYIYAAPVGTYEIGRSPFGANEMAGNVEEWVADWYQADYYAVAPVANPPGPPTGKHRVVRGGDSRSYTSTVRCAARSHEEPDYRNFTLGFRCAKDY